MTGIVLPGWTVPARIALLTGVVVVALLVLSAVVASDDPTSLPALTGRITGGLAVSGLVIVVVVVLTRLVEHRRLREIGLGVVSRGWRWFLVGVAAWFVPAALTFGVLALLGLPLTVTAQPGRLGTVLVLLFLAVLLSEAIPEEIVFRGHVTAVLAERLRGRWVIAVQTALFTIAAVVLRGVPGPLDMSLFVAMGVVLGHLRMVTGSVWTTIGFHVAFQTGSQLVLTHDVVTFSGSAGLAMLALGVVPFTVAMVIFSVRDAVRSDDGSVASGTEPAAD